MNIIDIILKQSFVPPEAVANEAKRALKWREEHGRGGTRVGLARANQLADRRRISLDTIFRMNSYFSRHEVDKKAEGFRPGEKGYPSNGRIAWGLWGGDAGWTWAKKIIRQVENESKEVVVELLKELKNVQSS